MSNITDFLPRYRELNALFASAVNGGAVSYVDQRTITGFYRQFSEVTGFEKMVLDIVLEKDKPTWALLLSGIKTEIENNIRLYESAKENLDAIDIPKICKEQSDRYNFAIEAQAEAVAEYRKELNQVNGSLDSIGFRDHTPHEEEQLWRKHEHLTKLYGEEKEKLNALYDQKKRTEQEAAQYCENLFGKIYNLSLSFSLIIICYLTPEAPAVETPAEAVEESAEEKPTPIPTLLIEPEMIFRSKMFDKLISLEKKLIADKFLSDDLQWVSTHDNGKTDIKKLVTFLTALIDNNYFLPNRDPKIKTFFEARYQISIGQNFEKKRREPLVSEYKMAFYEYPF